MLLNMQIVQLNAVNFRCHIVCCMTTVYGELVTNGLSHPYHLDESTFMLGLSGEIFHFYFNFR